MFALLPLIGGLLLGRFAARKVAITVQVVFFAVAIAALTISAPDHSASYADSLWIGPALAVLSAGTLLAGFKLAGRTERRRTA